MPKQLALLVASCVCALPRQTQTKIEHHRVCIAQCSIHILFTSFETCALREIEGECQNQRQIRTPCRHTYTVHMVLIVHAANISSTIFPTTTIRLLCIALLSYDAIVRWTFLSLSHSCSLALSLVKCSEVKADQRTNEPICR